MKQLLARSAPAGAGQSPVAGTLPAGRASERTARMRQTDRAGWSTSLALALALARSVVLVCFPTPAPAVLEVSQLASPNFIRGVFKATSFPPEAIVGSHYLQNLFTAYFDQQGLAYNLVPHAACTDRAIFAEAGIATGGVFVCFGHAPTSRRGRPTLTLASAACDARRCFRIACVCVCGGGRHHGNTAVGLVRHQDRVRARPLRRRCRGAVRRLQLAPLRHHGQRQHSGARGQPPRARDGPARASVGCDIAHAPGRVAPRAPPPADAV